MIVSNQAEVTPVLSVRDLRVRYAGAADAAAAGVSLSIAPGEVVALVGESGSGKSSVANALLGLLGAVRGRPAGAEGETSGADGSASRGEGRGAARAASRTEVSATELRIAGQQLLGAPARAWRGVRGAVVARIAQDPLAALNPNQRIGAQLTEAARWHAAGEELGQVRGKDHDRERVAERVRTALVDAGLDQPDALTPRFPHELSGGQRQRVLIALALITTPSLIIADEPTSSVDATVRGRIAAQLARLARERGQAMLVITHDLGLAAQLADRTLVMHAGHVVEAAATASLLASPKTPIAQRLVAAARTLSLPEMGQTGDGRGSRAASFAPTTDSSSARPLLSLEAVTVNYASATAEAGHAPAALAEVTLEVLPGESLGIVGESGAGKSTLLRAALGAAELTSGTVRFDGVDLASLGREPMRALRRRFQLVQQDPFASLDPRFTVARCIAEPLRAHGVGTRATQRERVRELLALVQLPQEFASRRPRQLSGGQRQRVALARALALAPELVYLDEALSALDATVQVDLLELLGEIKSREGVAFVSVSHDLGALARMADRIAVLHDGRLVELGATESLLAAPRAPQTQELVAAARMTALSPAHN